MARMERPTNSITASIRAVTPSQVQALTGAATGVTYWRYYDKVADIRFIVNLSGRLLSMSIPRVEKFNEATGVWEFQESFPGEIVGALSTIYESPGGLEDIARRFCQQYVMDGQDYLVGYNVNGTLQIEALSKDELKSDGQGFYRAHRTDAFTNAQVTGGDGLDRLPRGTKVSRVWRRHPQWSEKAETPMEALVEDMETLIFLNAALRARVKSRLASAGILFLPNSLIETSTADRPDGTDEDIDPITRKMINAMVRAIEDPDSPEASLPIIVRGPNEVGALIKHITLDRMIDETEMALRTELRQNIAHGLDAPAQVGGDGEQVNTNHWNAASVKMEMWEHTIAPIGDVLWEALTQMVLTRWLEKKGVEGRWRWRVDRDSVQIRDNQDEKTRVALDRTLIGDSAARRRLGIPVEDAPSDDEYIRAIGVKLGIPELAFYKIKVEGIDLSQLKSSREGAPPTGNGRDIPADTVGDRPDGRDPRVR